MKFEELRALIERHCTELLEESGEVYFGSLSALRQPNGLAILGLNPGGSGLTTLRDNLDRYAASPVCERFSGYLDQCWHEPFFSRYETCTRCLDSLARYGHVHQDRHQKRVARIAAELGVDLRETLALNAIWLQTRSAADLRQLLQKLRLPKMTGLFQSKFFPVIHELLTCSNVRLVLCLGNGATESAFNFFREAVGVARNEVVSVGESYRDGRYFVDERVGQRRIYFGIAHPGRFATSPIGLRRLRQLWSQEGTG